MRSSPPRSPGLVTAGLAMITIALLTGFSFFSAAPEQPIPGFSHKIHVTVNKIDCLHCHAGTDRSQLAGFPAVATCVGCHMYLGRVRQKPGIVKLFEYWKKKEPIPWVRVYYLPQFVQFKHKPHIRAGVACQTCHGDVGDMTVARMAEKITMGWCVGCHRNTQGRAKLAQAPTDCWTCHY
jgi:hypothetical protein